MAVRTTAADIGKIIEVDAAIDLDSFIEVANALVTECCVGQSYADARLKLIETWLAAHFYAMRDPRVVSETVTGIGERFQSAVALGFDTSHYGQMAMRLDTAGGLAALNEKTKAGKSQSIGVSWIGTPVDEEEE